MMLLQTTRNSETFEGHWNAFLERVIDNLPLLLSGLISAIIILILGLWFIKLLMRLLDRIFVRRNVDVSIRTFVGRLLNWGLKIILFIVVISQLGVQTSSFIAILGAAGLAIGLSLQGSLSNFAGGVLILTLKPFRVGDYIASSKGVEGTVMVIDIFNTKLNTGENLMVVVPNGELSNSSITNYTATGTRKSMIDVRVNYNADLKRAKEILAGVALSNPLALTDPAPQVVVTNLAESWITLSVRVSATNANFWTMHEQLLMECKAALEQAGIDIPYPQRDIHHIGKTENV